MQKTYPKKRFGQNFLTDKNIALKIVRAIDALHPQLVIEIGPGRGILTEVVIDQIERYVGVEIDSTLAEILQERFSTYPHFTLIQKDFLEFDLSELANDYTEYSIIILGNIPYNITSPILFKLFDHADLFDQAVIMVQKEVGTRIKAKEGNKDYGLLSIFSQLFAEVDMLFAVPSKLFFPKPKVDSAVMKFRFHKKVKERFADFELFKKIVQTCFQHRRKMLKNSLSMLFSGDVLSKLETSFSQRPEQLSIYQWEKLFHLIYKNIE